MSEIEVKWEGGFWNKLFVSLILLFAFAFFVFCVCDTGKGIERYNQIDKACSVCCENPEAIDPNYAAQCTEKCNHFHDNYLHTRYGSQASESCGDWVKFFNNFQNWPGYGKVWPEEHK